MSHNNSTFSQLIIELAMITDVDTLYLEAQTDLVQMNQEVEFSS